MERTTATKQPGMMRAVATLSRLRRCRISSKSARNCSLNVEMLLMGYLSNATLRGQAFLKEMRLKTPQSNFIEIYFRNRN